MILGFLNPFRIVRLIRLRGALERYRLKAGLEETLALARRLSDVGESRAAVKYLRTGLKRFANSTELRTLHGELRARLTEDEVRTLERAVRRSPREEDLADLIEHHRALGNFDRCLKLAEESEAQFRDSWLLNLAIGKSLYHRYLERRDAADGERAADHLRRARAAMPDPTKALFYLAALLSECGPPEEAEGILRELNELAPRDPRALRFLDYLSGRSSGRPGKAPAAEEGEACLPLLDALRRTAGVQGVFVISPEGKLLAEHLGGEEHFQLQNQAPAVAALAKTVLEAPGRMGMGEFGSCVLEGDPWRIFLAQAHGNGVVVFAGHSLEAKEFEALVDQHRGQPGAPAAEPRVPEEVLR